MVIVPGLSSSILGVAMEHVEIKWPVTRKRSRYSNEFKQDLVAACKAPGVSMASIALAHGINANLLRRWVSQRSQKSGSAATLSSHASSVSSPTPTPTITPNGELPSPTESSRRGGFIRITPEHGAQATGDTEARLEMRLQQGDLQLLITGSSVGCAAFVRTLLA